MTDKTFEEKTKSISRFIEAIIMYDFDIRIFNISTQEKPKKFSITEKDKNERELRNEITKINKSLDGKDSDYNYTKEVFCNPTLIKYNPTADEKITIGDARLCVIKYINQHIENATKTLGNENPNYAKNLGWDYEKRKKDIIELENHKQIITKPEYGHYRGNIHTEYEESIARSLHEENPETLLADERQIIGVMDNFLLRAQNNPELPNSTLMSPEQESFFIGILELINRI